MLVRIHHYYFVLLALVVEDGHGDVGVAHAGAPAVPRLQKLPIVEGCHQRGEGCSMRHDDDRFTWVLLYYLPVGTKDALLHEWETA